MDLLRPWFYYEGVSWWNFFFESAMVFSWWFFVVKLFDVILDPAVRVMEFFFFFLNPQWFSLGGFLL